MITGANIKDIKKVKLGANAEAARMNVEWENSRGNSEETEREGKGTLWCCSRLCLSPSGRRGSALLMRDSIDKGPATAFASAPVPASVCGKSNTLQANKTS